MQTTTRSKSPDAGFTLLEMSVVIGVLLVLIGTGMSVSSKIGDWRLGRTASETLRQVYTAQRMFLAENPTRQVSTITAADVIPYLPGGGTALPTVKSLTGAQLSIAVNTSPPFIDAGSGVRYDPSDSNTDALWDLGE